MIYLRPLKKYDINRLYEIRSISENYFPIKFRNETLNKTTEWYYNFINEDNAIRLGICSLENNILVGYITLGNIDYIKSECEFHIVIDNKYQSNGFGKNSILICQNYVKNILKIQHLYLKVHKENIKALQIYEKMGLKKETETDIDYMMKFN